MVIESVPSSGNAQSIGSETSWAPLGTEKLVFPLKVTGVNVLLSTDVVPTEPFAGRATVTAVISRLLTPKTLVNRRRKGLPPWVTLSVCRIEASTKTPVEPLNGAGGRLAGSTSWGMVAQVLTQLLQDASLECPLARPLLLPLFLAVGGSRAARTERVHTASKLMRVRSRIMNASRLGLTKSRRQEVEGYEYLYCSSRMSGFRHLMNSHRRSDLKVTLGDLDSDIGLSRRRWCQAQAHG